LDFGKEKNFGQKKWKKTKKSWQNGGKRTKNNSKQIYRFGTSALLRKFLQINHLKNSSGKRNPPDSNKIVNRKYNLTE